MRHRRTRAHAVHMRVRRQKGEEKPSPRIFSLNWNQARWLQEASETPGGCYVPISCGREPGELVDAGLAEFQGRPQVSDTLTLDRSKRCEWTDLYLVITAAGLAMLEKHRRKK